MIEEHAPTIPYIREIIVFLAATVAVTLLARRLNITPILGYLAVGLLIGPHALGLIRDVDGVQRISELGVVLLLFVIGLELSMQRLKALRHFIFGLGAAQVIISAGVFSAIAYYAGLSAEAALVIGLSLALSSTAMVMQLLTERGEIASRAGRVSIAVLLFQDLAVVPVLLLVNMFAQSEVSILTQMGLAGAKAIAAVVGIYIAGRLIVYPLFRAVAKTRISEIFVALTLIGILGTSWLTAQAGLSMALGAFLAGLLLAETEFRHQVESDIQPFKGLMLALFFMGVGMTMDIRAIADLSFLLIAALIGLIVIKAAVIFTLARFFSIPNGTALHIGLMLAGGGEFAFVVIGMALTEAVVETPIAHFILVLTGLSMMITPFLASFGMRLKNKFERPDPSLSFLPEACATDEMEGHVIIAGFGRVGQMVARLLRAQNVPFRGLDLNVARVRRFHAQGEPVYYGDASRTEILGALGADKAAAVVVTIDNHEAANRTVENAHHHWPSLNIFVRARDGMHSRSLREAGAEGVVPETVETSLQLSAQTLRALGVPRDTVNKLVSRVRAEHYELILAPLVAAPSLSATYDSEEDDNAADDSIRNST